MRISKQWTTRRNACWELGVTSWTRGTPTETANYCTANTRHTLLSLSKYTCPLHITLLAILHFRHEAGLARCSFRDHEG